MYHVESGRKLYHTSLCNCCQHGVSTTQSADDPQPAAADDTELAPAANSRLDERCTDMKLTTESRPLPQHQDNIPLDVSNNAGTETASVDVLKGLSRLLH